MSGGPGTMYTWRAGAGVCCCPASTTRCSVDLGEGKVEDKTKDTDVDKDVDEDKDKDKDIDKDNDKHKEKEPGCTCSPPP